MTNQIKTIAKECEALGIKYELDRQDCIKFPGGLKVYWDNQAGVEPGLVAEWADGWADPVEIDEVISELGEEYRR